MLIVDQATVNPFEVGVLSFAGAFGPDINTRLRNHIDEVKPNDVHRHLKVVI